MLHTARHASTRPRHTWRFGAQPHPSPTPPICISVPRAGALGQRQRIQACVAFVQLALTWAWSSGPSSLCLVRCVELSISLAIKLPVMLFATSQCTCSRLLRCCVSSRQGRCELQCLVPSSLTLLSPPHRRRISWSCSTTRAAGRTGKRNAVSTCAALTPCRWVASQATKDGADKDIAKYNGQFSVDAVKGSPALVMKV